MRGPDEHTSHLFSYLSPEQRVRPDHPLRAIRLMTDAVLRELSPRFDRMYSDIGRPSIPPEQLLRALLLQSLYTVRSERLLMEEIDYSILFRWFVGLGLDEPIWSPTTFTKNRDRLLEGDVAAAFFDAVRRQARQAGLLSDEHFTVDGTLLEAWASLKSFRAQGRRPTEPPDDPGQSDRRFPRRTRRNDTHASTTDPDARSARKGGRKGGEAGVRRPRAARQSPRAWSQRLCDGGHGHRRTRGRAVVLLGGAAGRARPSAATRATTSPALSRTLRALGITPHVAQKAQYTRDRRPDDAPPGLCHQSAETETGRAGLRLDEDRRRAAQAAAPRRRAGRLDGDLHRRGL